MQKKIAHKIIVSLSPLLLMLGGVKAHGQEASGEEVARPVSSVYSLSVGSASILDTYLSPVKNTGTEIRLEYERMQAMRFNPEKWIMQMNVGVDYDRVQTPARNHTEHGLMVDFRWGMMHRWKNVLTENLTFAAGGSTQVRGGAIYKPSNSNNVVSVKANWSLNATAKASYHLSVLRVPITLSYQATLPIVGVFYSPEFEESYYEIYLGNTSGLAHVSWWANKFDMINVVAADLHLGSTILRLGYRNRIETSWINNLNTQMFTHTAVVGVGGEWLSVNRKKALTPNAKIISSMY